MAEPGDWSRGGTQRCGTHNLADTIASQERKPQSLAAFPHPSGIWVRVEAVAVSSGQSTLSATLRTGEADEFLAEQWAHAVAGPCEGWGWWTCRSVAAQSRQSPLLRREHSAGAAHPLPITPELGGVGTWDTWGTLSGSAW